MSGRQPQPQGRAPTSRFQSQVEESGMTSFSALLRGRNVLSRTPSASPRRATQEGSPSLTPVPFARSKSTPPPKAVPEGYWRRFMKNRGDYLAQHLQEQGLTSFSAVARAQNEEHERSTPSTGPSTPGSGMSRALSFKDLLKMENKQIQSQEKQMLGNSNGIGSVSFAKVMKERQFNPALRTNSAGSTMAGSEDKGAAIGSMAFF